MKWEGVIIGRGWLANTLFVPRAIEARFRSKKEMDDYLKMFRDIFKKISIRITIEHSWEN